MRISREIGMLDKSEGNSTTLFEFPMFLAPMVRRYLCAAKPLSHTHQRLVYNETDERSKENRKDKIWLNFTAGIPEHECHQNHHGRYV